MATIGIAILAAGKGTRLKIDLPKALCPALGKPIVDHVVSAARKFAQTANIECSMTASSVSSSAKKGT
ncbi:MAG: NTP transferase domain-containing protein [Bacteriovoracaceae bacterium]|nr:NTP transferase domain-containing protein [Bacteriovoracaceae bacterium]